MKMSPPNTVESSAGGAPKRRSSRRYRRQVALDPQSLPLAEDALSEISGGLRKLLGCYERVVREHAGRFYADERNRQEEILGINELSERLGIRKRTISDALIAGELKGTFFPFKGGKSERGTWKIRVGDALAWHSALIARASKVGEAVSSGRSSFYADLGSTPKAMSKPRSEDGRFPERQRDGQHG